MITALSAFFGGLWDKTRLYVVLVIAGIVVLWQAYRSVKTAGRREVVAEQNAQALKNVEKANEARREIAGGNTDAVRKFYID